MKDTNTIVLAVLGALVIGGVGFFIGRHTNTGFGRNWVMGSAQNGALEFGRDGMMGKNSGQGRMGGKGMGNFGEITKIDGTKVTLQYTDGSTKEVTVSSDAVVNTVTKGALKDLKVGSTIMITGGGFWNQGETIIVKP